MKINLHHLLLVFCVIAAPLGPQCAYAQDGNYPIPDSFEELEPIRDKVINSPGEVDPSDNRATVASVKDASVSPVSTTARSKPPEPANDRAGGSNESSTSAAEDDDSLLTFNFLYYLFEKYKLQDIVDR